jgi:tetratricopeptide (TPR) repeat protein
MQQIRHTYLHYLLDPLSLKYPDLMKRLDPLLDAVKTAPMDESFKSDASLLVTECLIRAVEARTAGDSKEAEVLRERAVEASMEQGFILTQYFYDTLVQFEKGPTGFRNVFGSMLLSINVGKEQRRAAQVQFATSADPELLHLSRPNEGKLLKTAEQRLSAGDSASAQKLAQEALDEKSEDPGRALFILAQAATMNRKINDARDYFQKALQNSREPKVVAWSHIYLGRIFDLQEDRDAAIGEYRAAASASASLPEAKAAAEQGLQQPYEPPSHPQQ